MTARLIRQSNRGSLVEYPDGTRVAVDSERIRTARYALVSAQRPVSQSFSEFQDQVMEPLRQEFRAALKARTTELMEVRQ